MTGVLKYAKKSASSEMTASFNVRKMYSTVERMDSCGYSNSTFERTYSWIQHFLEINILLLKDSLKQWMTASSPVKLNIIPFKEWVTVIFL